MIAQMAKRLLGKMFGKHLLVTNTIASTCIMGIGDILQQQIELRFGDSKKHDWKRTGRMMIMGVVLGPMVHVWYGYLDRRFVGAAKNTVLKKILCDQVFGSPTFSFTFMTGMALLQGKSFKEGIHEFRKKFLFVYFCDWLIWPPTQYVNFYLVPPHLRAVYVYFIDIVWYTFSSYVVHKYHPTFHFMLRPAGETDTVVEEDYIFDICLIIR